MSDAAAARFQICWEKRKSLPREEVRQAFEKNRTATGRRSAAVPSGAVGGGVGRLNPEALREEVHCFVEIGYTGFPRMG